MNHTTLQDALSEHTEAIRKLIDQHMPHQGDTSAVSQKVALTRHLHELEQCISGLAPFDLVRIATSGLHLVDKAEALYNRHYPDYCLFTATVYQTLERDEGQLHLTDFPEPIPQAWDCLFCAANGEQVDTPERRASLASHFEIPVANLGIDAITLVVDPR